MDIDPLPGIETRIQVMRGNKVMVDADLAKRYGVTTKRLNEQVKRNRARFQGDFMFQLSEAEKVAVVASCDHLRKLKFSKSVPYAFTEHGAIQAANVLASPRSSRWASTWCAPSCACAKSPRPMATCPDASMNSNTRPRPRPWGTTISAVTHAPNSGRCSTRCAP